MTKEKEAVQETKKTKDLSVVWLISHLRWGWLIVAFIIVILSLPLTKIASVGYGLLGLGVLYNLAVVGLLFARWYPDGMVYVVAILDTIIGIGLMWVFGGHNAFMLPILLFPVLAAVFQINTEAGLLLSALPIAIAYAVSLIIEIVAQQDVMRLAALKTATDLVVLFGAGAIAGYISQKKLKLKEDEDQEEVKRLKVENKRAKVIYEMANTLGSTLDYQKVLRAMLDLAQLALSEADSKTNVKSSIGMVLLFDGDGALGKLKVMTGRNISRLDDGISIIPQEGMLSKVIYKAEAIIEDNVKQDPVLREFSTLKNCNSAICAPLRAGFDMYGAVLFATPEENAYTEDHAALLSTFCKQAIIALQNAELYEALDLKQKKLLDKEAQARRELARNLHDGPTQSIAAISMRLNFVHRLLEKEGNIPKTLDEIRKIEEISLRTTKEIRNMLFTLRPVVLETQGLGAAIEQYTDRMRDLHGLNIKLDVSRYDAKISTEAEGVIFAIIEEAVGNAKKYARATVIGIKLAVQNNTVIAEVADNGKGFDVKAVKSSYDQRGSLGLLNMEERAQMVGGRYKISSTKGKGTRVRVQIPLDKAR